MESKIYITKDELQDMIYNNNFFLPKLNKHIHETFKITNNPLKQGSFTYGAYHNWMKMNPGFTFKEYESKKHFFI